MAFNTNPGRQSFTATSGQTVFDFNFKIFVETDIKVYLTPVGSTPDDATDLLTYGSEYTVTIDGDDGGTVTLLTGATLNDTIVLERVLPRTRDTSYVTNGDLKAVTLNLDQDYQTYMLIDDFNTADRSLSLPSTDVTMSPELPATVLQGYIRVKADGTGFEYDDSVPQGVKDAADSVLNANSWANEAEDVPVKVYTNGIPADRVPTVYSAKHYQAKAKGFKDGAELEKWDAEAKALTALSYATEAEDTPVNVVTSDGDGTFTYTPQVGVFSSLHYAAKANTTVSDKIDTVNTIAELLALDTSLFSNVNVLGYYAPNDGGGGIFYWDSSSTETSDNGIIFGSGTGRWKRRYEKELNVKWFGAKGDGTTDDTISIQSALDIGGNILLSAGVYLITSPLVINSETSLKGVGYNASRIIISSSFDASDSLLKNAIQSGTYDVYYNSDILIQDIGFDGNLNSSRITSLLSFAKILNLNIHKCSFSDNTHMGISFSSSKDVKITKCHFSNLGRPKPSTVSAPAIWCDITAEGVPYDILIDNNYFVNNNWSAAYFMPTRGTFSNNICINNGESTVFTNTNGVELNYINNKISGAGRSNISASGIETGGSNLVISGNHISSCGDSGISLTDTQNVLISANHIFNNGQEVGYFTEGSGIAILTLSAAPSMPHHIDITGNRIGDRQGTKTQYSAVVAGGTGDPIPALAIHNNDFTEQKTTTVDIQAGKFGAGSYVKDNYDKDGNLSKPFVVVSFQGAVAVGNLQITGVGFRPRAIELEAIEVSGSFAYKSNSSMDGNTTSLIYTSSDGAGNAGSITSNAVVIKDSSGSDRCIANFVSFDEDGFTLNFTNVTVRPWCVAKCYQ